MTDWQVRDVVIEPHMVDDTGVVDMPPGWEPFEVHRTTDVVVVICRRPLPSDTDDATDRQQAARAWVRT